MKLTGLISKQVIDKDTACDFCWSSFLRTSASEIQFLNQFLVYADDVAVMVNSIQEVQDVTSAQVTTMNTNEMRVNAAKESKDFLYISRSSDEFDLYMEDKKLHQAIS